MRLLEQEAGISYEHVVIDDLPDIASRLFASLPSFAVPPIFVQRDPTFVASDQRRREALMRAVSELTHDWPQEERRMAASMLDVLWTPLSYERLVAELGVRRRRRFTRGGMGDGRHRLGYSRGQAARANGARQDQEKATRGGDQVEVPMSQMIGA